MNITCCLHTRLLHLKTQWLHIYLFINVECTQVLLMAIVSFFAAYCLFLSNSVYITHTFACHLQEQCNLPFDKGYHLYHCEQIQVFEDAQKGLQFLLQCLFV